MSSFHLRLRELREQTGLTQKDIADALSISRQAYVTYETGTRKPDIELLGKIADYFNTSADYLLGRCDDAEDMPNSEFYALAAHHEGKMTEEAAAELQALLSSKEFLDKVNSIIDKREKKKE